MRTSWNSSEFCRYRLPYRSPGGGIEQSDRNASRSFFDTVASTRTHPEQRLKNGMRTFFPLVLIPASIGHCRDMRVSRKTALSGEISKYSLQCPLTYASDSAGVTFSRMILPPRCLAQRYAMLRYYRASLKKP